MFKNLKISMEAAFAMLLLNCEALFLVDVTKEQMWDTYLDGFAPEDKQEHNCNACKSFIRQYGNIVGIKDGKKVSIWNFVAPEMFNKSVVMLDDLCTKAKIRDIFYAESTKLGNDTTMQRYTVDAETKKQTLLAVPISWNHFSLTVPKWTVQKADAIPSMQGNVRDTKNVFKRSLDDLSVESTETVIELIAQGSLYRGDEFKGLLQEFLKHQKAYKKLKNEVSKDLYCWEIVPKLNAGLGKIRNTAIGTLLIDLSLSKELDYAVAAFEKVVAPTNYKRPTALVTKKMIEQAEKDISELGYMESLGRRYATAEDLSVSNVLYVNRDAKAAKDIFGKLKEDVAVNPKTLTKVEEIAIDDFIEKVLPTAKSVEILLENKHLGNLSTLITAKDPEAPTLFKWKNPFSWCYTNAISDSMKERVKDAGGKVDGVLRFSIQWNEDGKSSIDLDAHAHEPNGAHIYFSNYRGKGVFTSMTGNLDVDMRSPIEIGVENITWSDLNKMKEGVYKFRVHNYSGHSRFDGVRCEIEFDGQIHEFAYNKAFIGYIDIAEVTYSKAKGFSVKSALEAKSSVYSKKKWNLDTNKFHKVKTVLNSPNFWEDKAGNKHVFFMLEGAHCDEQPRGFFNEFLKPELDKNKRVFEILGSKMQVEEAEKQLSGVGFSSTQRAEVVVKVQGKFERLLKVKI